MVLIVICFVLFLFFFTYTFQNILLCWEKAISHRDKVLKNALKIY